jgi:hypothetical protein
MAKRTRYMRSQIDAYREQVNDQRRHLFWIIPLGFGVLFIALNASGWLVIAVPAFIIGALVYRKPITIVKEYDEAATSWNALLERSNPSTVLDVYFPLQENEKVFYSEPSVRFEERRTGQVIDTQSRTKNAIGGAALGGLLFGPAGAIVGGSMARRQTTGTATDVFDVVPVDNGSLAVTSSRVVFLGTRDTIDVPASKVMRFSALEGTDLVNVEYAGRAPGESYTVNPALFTMSMVRRGNDKRFALPTPPPPLSTDVNDSIAFAHTTPERSLEA